MSASMMRRIVICVFAALSISCNDPRATEVPASHTSHLAVPDELERAYQEAGAAHHSLLRCSDALAERRDKLLSDFHEVERNIADRFGEQELRRLRLALADSQHMLMIPPCAGEAGLEALARAVASLASAAGTPSAGRSGPDQADIGGPSESEDIAATTAGGETLTVADVRRLGFVQVDTEIRYADGRTSAIIFPAVFFGPEHIHGEPIRRRYRCEVPADRQGRSEWTAEEMANWPCRKLL